VSAGIWVTLSTPTHTLVTNSENCVDKLKSISYRRKTFESHRELILNGTEYMIRNERINTNKDIDEVLINVRSSALKKQRIFDNQRQKSF
jgi:hypothetical protein